eukprot:TRINITY_DN2427_c0_g1_i1.p1 TRINITY_DN2427_c0_g1~~TRINITY_DN2427_c0_g1_i1.p1  ORF type:complete len:395 (+),score=64.96 TRINITY_DN2427_c0_g1_i1:58-1242(+)
MAFHKRGADSAFAGQDNRARTQPPSPPQYENAAAWLNAILNEVEAPGVFACGDWMPFVLPGLVIDGYGVVTFPLQPKEAVGIIKHCERAPFGRGVQTLVDINVRNTWQLHPSKVQLNSRAFLQSIADLIQNTVAPQMGFQPNRVTFNLYKVLLYEPGGFFLPHRDTEKEVGMFGSLIITLPSNFSGGQLSVTHQGHTKRFPPLLTEQFPSYTAFYADCKHEILPVTEGYRIALVFNLISTAGGLPKPPSMGPIRQVVECMEAWERHRYPDPSLAVYVTEHQYTAAGLSPHVLKGRDRTIYSVLRAARDEHMFDLYLAFISCNKSGMAIMEDREYELYTGADVETSYEVEYAIEPEGQTHHNLELLITDESEHIFIANSSALQNNDADADDGFIC